MHSKLRLSVIICLALSVGFVNVNCAFGSRGAYQNKEYCNEDFLIVSTIDGYLTALDVNTGKRCWAFLVDSESFLSSSLTRIEIHENGELYSLVPSLDGGLYKYDDTNKIIQKMPIDVNSLITYSTYLDSSTSAVGGKIKKIFGIHRLTGEVIFKCEIDGCYNMNEDFPENILLIEEMIQVVKAIDSIKGEKKWHFRVAELKVKLAYEPFDNYHSHHSNEEHALIPKIAKEFFNPGTFKISLKNGYAGRFNLSGEGFSWLFKTKYPITDAWFLKGGRLRSIDLFSKESGFFPVDMNDGKHSALLFLGIYHSQLFIKKSKVFRVKAANFNALSLYIWDENILFQAHQIMSKNTVSSNNSPFEEEEMRVTHINYNVSEHGFYLYTNFTVSENLTHCLVESSHVVQYINPIPLSFRVSVYILVCCVIFIVMHILWRMAVGEPVKQKVVLADACTSSVMEEQNVPEIIDVEFRSRFHHDFELVSILGRGGFGIVMDAKNKIDDCRYAVKRVCFRDQLDSSQLERMLREVKALAKLDHHGIVRYFNAWIEHPPSGWQVKKDLESNIFDFSQASFITTNKDLKKSQSVKVPPPKPDLLRIIDQNPLQPFGDILSKQIEDLKSELSKFSSSTLSEDYPSTRPDKTVLPHVEYKDNSSDSENSHENSVIFENPNEGYSEDSVIFENPNEGYSEDSVIFENPDEDVVFEKSDIQEFDKANNSVVFENSNEGDVIYEKDDSAMIENPSKSADDMESIVFENIDSEKIANKMDSATFAAHYAEFHKSKGNVDNVEKEVHFPIKESNSNNFEEDIQIESDLKHEISKVLRHGRFSSHVIYKNNESRKIDKRKRSPSKHSSMKRGKSDEMTLSQTKISVGYLYIQMQLCQKESLREWLDTHGSRRDYNRVLKIFYEIVDAVDYVHDCGLIHRDLKPSNIFFSMEGAIKIGDFGLATTSELEDEENITNKEQLLNIHTANIGTEFYMSPEQKRKKYDFKTDIYPLGIIFFELLIPFTTQSERCKVLLKVRRSVLPESFKSKFQQESILVTVLLEEDPKLRPTTKEIKKNPLFLRYSY